MAHFEPKSSRACSIIRSRTQASLPNIYSSIRSVKSLGREGFCDPHDPCCVKRDPEVFLHQSVLRSQYRKQCVPKNPHHFEYTILHRVKMRNRLQMAAERQQNPELTEEEIEKIREQETAATTSETVARAKPTITSSNEYFSEHPEILPPSPELINGEELKKTLEGLTSAALAHEIALNKDFKLVKPEKKAESELTSKESEEMRLTELDSHVSKEAQLTLDAKDRYWKMVDHVLLTKTFKEAKNTLLDLMNTLKTMLQATMLPHNLRLKLKIDQELDLRKIGKEIDREIFDITHYMDFILDTLSALCCPIHDQEILEIRNIEVPSRQIRECIDLMETMNLDMANFIISQSRKQVLQNCVLYERNNFAIYIDTVYRMGKDPLRVTRNWVRRHAIPERSFSETMAHCFSELLDDHDENKGMPETLTLDWHRYPSIRNEIKRITIIGALVSAVYEYSHSLLLDSPDDVNDFEKSQIATLKNLRLLSKLREEINMVLLSEDLADPEKLNEALERCCGHVIQVVDQHLVAELCEGIALSQKEHIVGMIMQLGNSTNSSRVDLLNRVKNWYVELAKEDGREKVQAPQNLSIIGSLIIVPITEMMRLCMYNRGVFDILYREIYEGNCPPPSVYPPGQNEKSANQTIILDANKYGDQEKDSHFPMDEGIMNLVTKLKGFSGRTMVYRRSHIDPRIKPMYEADGTFIIPPEQQPNYHPKEMNAIEQKHYDEYLLAHEPTLEEDYQGVYVFNVGDPDWMFGYTTEQLLKLMERENLINANKLRRIKERLYQEVLESRAADNLPIFQKLWREEVGTLHKEFCRLQRILVKGPTPLPEGAFDEPSGKRVFPGACELKPQPKEEIPQFTKKGERILYSRGRGEQFAQSSSTTDMNGDPEGMDLERFEKYEAEEGEDEAEDPHARRDGRTPYDDSKKYYMEARHKPETPMQLLSRNISVGIEREKTKRLGVGGIRIQIQKSFEKSLLAPSKDFRKPKPNPFTQSRKSKPRMNYYPGNLDDDTQFDLPRERISQGDLFRGAQPVPLIDILPIYQERKSTQLQRRRHNRSQHQGLPMSRAALMARRRSAQFQVRDLAPRKSGPMGSQYSRDSIDSLQTLVGSLQEIRKPTPKKSKQKSQLQQSEDIAPPPTTEDEDEQIMNDQTKIQSDDDQDGGLKSGKIRFEIPASENNHRDPTVKEKIRDRRPTSVRTTRFTVPDVAMGDGDPNRAMKIKGRRATSVTTVKTTKTPRFGALPEKTNRHRRESVKIRERRPTPMLKSPMFAYLPQFAADANEEDNLLMQPGHFRLNDQHKEAFDFLRAKGKSQFYQKGVPPGVGIFPSIFKARASQKIQQRSKTPEPNDVAQEFKKTNIPIKGQHPRASAQVEDLMGDSRADLDAMTPINDDDDSGTGLMRIKKRRNIGRVLTPPFSRNERSNSMTVLDFRSSMFYKRSKSTVASSKNEKEGKRQLIGMLNKSNFKTGDWKGADKVKFD